MAPGVYSAISEYFDRMHNEIIWPAIAGKDKARKGNSKSSETTTPPFRPDRLVDFQHAMMTMHAKSVVLFRPTPKPCKANCDCPEGMECQNGGCVSTWAPHVLSEGKPCHHNGDCEDQGWECINGVCTPPAGDFVIGAVNQVPDYNLDPGLRAAINSYLDNVAALLVAGLAKHPARIKPVRKILVEGWADCCKVAGIGLPCGPAGCNDGWTCVDGICVPVPFRLVARSSTGRG